MFDVIWAPCPNSMAPKGRNPRYDPDLHFCSWKTQAQRQEVICHTAQGRRAEATHLVTQSFPHYSSCGTEIGGWGGDVLWA